MMTMVVGPMNYTNGSSISFVNFNNGIDISDDDTLYIADTNNNWIVTITADGHRSIFESGPGISRAEFYGPFDISVSKTSIYVIDTRNYRIKRYTKNATNPTTMPCAASFFESYYLFVDSSSSLYLSDFENNQVVCFAAGHSFPQARFGTTVAGDDTAGSDLSQLNCPSSVIVDTHGNIYFSEERNIRVVRWTFDSDVSICIADCSGRYENNPNQLKGPQDLAFDSDGSLYVSDTYNNRVQKFQILNDPSTTTNQTLTTSSSSLFSSSSLSIIQLVSSTSPNGNLSVSTSMVSASPVSTMISVISVQTTTLFLTFSITNCF
ncbi:unnamed protein product [Adineta ricciae]|uniref:NHL repeat containing protein-like protein n=1 Tax=Adineta ricciae TaxID=249248 RepID=A0A814QP89_ADIRI|nr:unnamed protein product [Adineta ricciae]